MARRENKRVVASAASLVRTFETNQLADAETLARFRRERGEKLLKELQAEFCLSDWIDGELPPWSEMRQGIRDSEVTQSLEGRTLFDQAPVKCRWSDGEEACWRTLAEEHPDWGVDEYCIDNYIDEAGGRFMSLPTAIFVGAGNILFVAESQIDQLRAYPVICRTYENGRGDAWLTIMEVQHLVIVPDGEICEGDDDVSARRLA